MRAIALILFLTIVPVSLFAQASPDMDEPPEVEVYKEGEWGGIPGMNGSGITLINQTSFPFLMGAAITSYTVAELVGKDSTLNYYQSRMGLYGVTNRTTIAFQSFGNFFSDARRCARDQCPSAKILLETGSEFL